MPYYPTFAFFEHDRPLKDVAQLFAAEIGPELPEISFEVNDASDTKIVTFDSQVKAGSFLKQQELAIARFWLAGDFDSVEVARMRKGVLAIDFWDFEPDIYDSDGPTQAMKDAKLQLAITLHRILVQTVGAWFSYTSSADSKYIGIPDHFDTAETIFEAVAKRAYHDITQILNQPPYFWLVGLKKSTELAQTLERPLRQDFREVINSVESVVFEHKESKPYFLM